MRLTTYILGAIGIVIAAMLLALVPVNRVEATGFPSAQDANTINLTLLSATTSNKTGTAYFVESATTHNLQIVTYCTNAVSNVISASLDGTSWSRIATNSASASSTNMIVFIGYRFSYLRADFTQTTANGSTNSIIYLGGRQ